MATLRLPRPVSSAYTFLGEVVREYSKDHGNLVAAAVAFYLFMSLIPLLLLAIAGLGFVLGSPERAKEIVFSYMREYFPSLSTGGGLTVRSIVEEIVRGREAATGVGIVFLVWSASTAMSIVERAINVAWDVAERRMFLINRLFGVAMLVVVAVLFIASFGATAALDALRSANVRLFGLEPASWPWMWNFLGYLIPLTVTLLAFTLMYKFLPCTHVPLRAAISGGVFAGVLWEAAKIGFSFYISRYASYSRVYGSLTGVVVLLVWINYSAVVAFLGAEAGSTWARRHRRAA
jgi:membrane protein